MHGELSMHALQIFSRIFTIFTVKIPHRPLAGGPALLMYESIFAGVSVDCSG